MKVHDCTVCVVELSNYHQFGDGLIRPDHECCLSADVDCTEFGVKGNRKIHSPYRARQGLCTTLNLKFISVVHDQNLAESAGNIGH